MEELVLNLVIEGLREHMIRLAEKRGSLVDPEVVAISSKLDEFLVRFQQLKLKNTFRYRMVI